MRVKLQRISANRKLGPMPASYSERASCAPSCPLLAVEREDGSRERCGCYGDDWLTGRVWDRVTAGTDGVEWPAFCSQVARLPEWTMWRHDVVGDLPHADGRIDAVALGQLVEANRGRRGFTYTHHDPALGENGRWIRAANDWGLTVNLSANSPTDADTLADIGAGPVVCLLPAGETQPSRTPAGRRIVVCPYVTHGVQCIDCGLCQRADREAVIGFPAHGSAARKVEAVVRFYRRESMKAAA
jgi:hypothetical protein